MREIVEEYLNTYEPFILFGTSHIISISIAIILAIFIPIFAKNKLSDHYQYILGSIIGYLVMSSYIIWTILEIIAGTFDLKLHLPIHLCRMANLLLHLDKLYSSLLYLDQSLSIA